MVERNGRKYSLPAKQYWHCLSQKWRVKGDQLNWSKSQPPGYPIFGIIVPRSNILVLPQNFQNNDTIKNIQSKQNTIVTRRWTIFNEESFSCCRLSRSWKWNNDTKQPESTTARNRCPLNNISVKRREENLSVKRKASPLDSQMPYLSRHALQRSAGIL